MGKWIDRNDVNALALIVLFLIVIFGMTLVPPEWYTHR
jgi:hypothetical protein